MWSADWEFKEMDVFVKGRYTVPWQRKKWSIAVWV